MNFIESWCFLHDHEIFNVEVRTKISGNEGFFDHLNIDIPENNILTTRNSHFDRQLTILALDSGSSDSHSICLESGQLCIDDSGFVAHSHDYDLDVSAATFEEAIVALAIAVQTKFGSNLASSILVIPE